MGGKIKFILFTVVIIGVILYIYNSGIIDKGAQGLSSFFPQNASSSTSTFISPVIGPAITPGPASPPLISPPGSTSTVGGRTISPYEIPAGFTVDQLSPYFHEIRFNGAYSGKVTGSYGRITLSAVFSQNETIDVTAWQIKAMRGSEFIPQAVNFYDASGLSPASDIRLKSNDTLIMYSSGAPLNIRLNKCLGYLQHDLNFNPPLPGTCPQVDRSEVQQFTGACQNYIFSLGACQQPDLSNPQIPQNDYACRDYLSNNFNYRSCLTQHENDADFFSNQVWVWTGNDPLDPFHDTVELLDTNGLLVDLYTY